MLLYLLNNYNVLINMSIQLAKRDYSKGYQVALNQENLNELASKNFTTHTSVHAERLHKVSEFLFYPARISAQLLGRAIMPNPGKNKDYT